MLRASQQPAPNRAALAAIAAIDRALKTFLDEIGPESQFEKTPPPGSTPMMGGSPSRQIGRETSLKLAGASVDHLLGALRSITAAAVNAADVARATARARSTAAFLEQATIDREGLDELQAPLRSAADRLPAELPASSPQSLRTSLQGLRELLNSITKIGR